MTEQSTTERVFTPYDIQNCLYDQERVGYFREAIEATVKPGDIVVDGGSGTGVLGLLAAKAGARTVYCLELNREYVGVIKENARINGFTDQIVPMYGNAALVDLPEQVDVIISEVISGGLFYEPQLQIVRNLRRFLKPNGAVIPQVMTNYLELISAQDEIYGLKFSYDTRHRVLKDRPLTTKEPYLTVDFERNESFAIAAEVVIVATETGVANALRVPYSLQFSEAVFADRPTEFLLNPQTIFLPEPVAVEKGQRYRVAVEYQSGDSPLNATIKALPEDAAIEMSNPVLIRS